MKESFNDDLKSEEDDCVFTDRWVWNLPIPRVPLQPPLHGPVELPPGAGVDQEHRGGQEDAQAQQDREQGGEEQNGPSMRPGEEK